VEVDHRDSRWELGHGLSRSVVEMKFAHEFQAALLREGFPPHWVDSAVPYGQLKKIIKKVTRELQDLGLDSSTLSQLVSEVDSSSQPIGNESSVAFQYDFNGM
jgi:E3 ubiquitin-protein ligase BAH